MSDPSNPPYAPFFGVMGATAAIVFSCKYRSKTLVKFWYVRCGHFDRLIWSFPGYRWFQISRFTTFTHHHLSCPLYIWHNTKIYFIELIIIAWKSCRIHSYMMWIWITWPEWNGSLLNQSSHMTWLYFPTVFSWLIIQNWLIGNNEFCFIIHQLYFLFYLFSALGAAYGTAKSGTGIAAMSVMRPELIMKSIIPVVMAGIIAIYGLVVAALIANTIDKDNYSLFL